MSIYKISPGEANLDTEVECLPWTEVGERDWGVTANGYRISFEVMKTL